MGALEGKEAKEVKEVSCSIVITVELVVTWLGLAGSPLTLGANKCWSKDRTED